MSSESFKKIKVLLIGIYDTNTVSLAGYILRAFAEQFPVTKHFDISTIEFSIFGDSPEEVAKQIALQRPDIVGFSAYVWNIIEILKITSLIDCIIIIGGPQVTGIEESILDQNPAVDIIVSGEGEVTFVELLGYFAGQRSLDSINGICTHQFRTPPRALLKDLNCRPSPYERIFAENPRLSWISYESSRGCPMACGFCTWGYSREMRYLATERVLTELRLILKQAYIKNIYFCDSSLLLNKSRAKSILQFLIDQQCDKEIRFEFNAEQLDDELIDLLSQLPRNEFNFGLQSITDNALNAAGRKFNKARFEENYHKLVKQFPNTNITIDLIYGLPGDTFEGYLSSLEYAISLDKVRRILTNPLIALPGSRFFMEMARYGIELADKHSFIIKHSDSFSEADMEKARTVSFYVSLLYMNVKLLRAVKQEAARRGVRTIDFVRVFFGRLPFLSDRESPDMVPASISGFRRRNASLAEALQNYKEIVTAFNRIAAEPVVHYREAFSEYYHRTVDRIAT